ncbi:MAG: hypothetical protein LUE12_08780 [Ruminococcus sp.]|nr:hypothetical protein [Ruminococcus sp.]
MFYKNLNFLLFNSSSSRQYFDSLPIEIRSQLRERRDFIHTQFQLRQNSEYLQSVNKWQL